METAEKYQYRIRADKLTETILKNEWPYFSYFFNPNCRSWTFRDDDVIEDKLTEFAKLKKLDGFALDMTCKDTGKLLTLLISAKGRKWYR